MIISCRGFLEERASRDYLIISSHDLRDEKSFADMDAEHIAPSAFPRKPQSVSLYSAPMGCFECCWYSQPCCNVVHVVKCGRYQVLALSHYPRALTQTSQQCGQGKDRSIIVTVLVSENVSRRVDYMFTSMDDSCFIFYAHRWSRWDVTGLCMIS